MKMTPFIDIRNLTKAYPIAEDGAPLTVLSGIELKVFPGKTLALVGPSGSGKSTLLNIISGLDSPTSGEVWVSGNKVHDMSAKQAASFRNQTIGFIFQSHHLLPALTALENVMIPGLAGHEKRKDSLLKERAIELLKKVGLSERVHHLPSQLSGGERQRVAVARALINEPKLLLADEPTGALDQANAIRLMELLFQLNQEFETTLLVVTHSMDLAQKMDGTWSFEHGKLSQIKL